MNAVEIETGKVAWSKPVQPDCKNGRQERFPLCGERYGAVRCAAASSTSPSWRAPSMDASYHATPRAARSSGSTTRCVTSQR